MRRRNFIKGIVGSAAAWPLAVRAQQTVMPVIGFLHSASPDGNADRVRLFRQGLKEVGFVEGQNVAVEYRWAENQVERLPALAAELVRRPVTVIAVAGQPATFAAKAATTTIPIACIVAEDPVRLGLVTSIARPTGNLTGVNFFPVELSAKRLELLRELTAAVRIAALADPNNTQGTSMVRDLETAAHALSLEIKVFNAHTSREIDAAFAGFARERPDALFVGTGPFFTDRRVQLALQATSSARNRNDSGIVTPSAFAVVRLMTRSNLVGCSTGISAGFAPRRILSTRSPACRHRSGKFGPYDIRPPASTYSRTPYIIGSRAASANVLIRTLLVVVRGSLQT
jgi:putative tryptophan/tyrosine transport system substrate-binding protein